MEQISCQITSNEPVFFQIISSAKESFSIIIIITFISDSKAHNKVTPITEKKKKKTRINNNKSNIQTQVAHR